MARKAPRRKNGLLRFAASIASDLGMGSKPPQGELARAGEDPWSSRRLMKPYLANGQTGDPDDGVMYHELSEDPEFGYPYGIFDEMLLKDWHIAAMVQVRASAVLDCELSIEPYDDSDEASELAEWCSWALECIGGNSEQDWQNATAALLRAVPYGFQVCELVWNSAQRDGQWFWIVEQVKPRKHRRFTFGEKDELRIFTSPTESVPAPSGKFIVSRLYNPTDSPWGDPYLRKLYFPYLFKKDVISWGMNCVERFASPLPVGKIEEGAVVSKEELAELDRALAGFTTNGYVRLGPGMDLEAVPFVTSASTDIYDRMLDRFNREMSKAYLGSPMVMEASENGNQTIGAVLENRFLSIVSADARAVSRVWTRGILRQLVWWNFGEQGLALMPTLNLNVKEERDAVKDAQVFKTLREGEVPILKSDVYPRFGYTEPPEDVSDDELVKPPPPPVPPGMGFGAKPGKPGQGERADESQADPREGRADFAEDDPALERALRVDADRDRVALDPELRSLLTNALDGMAKDLQAQAREGSGRPF